VPRRNNKAQSVSCMTEAQTLEVVRKASTPTCRRDSDMRDWIRIEGMPCGVARCRDRARSYDQAARRRSDSQHVLAGAQLCRTRTTVQNLSRLWQKCQQKGNSWQWQDSLRAVPAHDCRYQKRFGCRSTALTGTIILAPAFYKGVATLPV
jgi:hypothetical protein